MKEQNESPENTEVDEKKVTAEPIKPEPPVDINKQAEEHGKHVSTVLNDGLQKPDEEEEYRESATDAEPVTPVSVLQEINFAGEKAELKGLNKEQLNAKLEKYEKLLSKGLLDNLEFETLKKEIRRLL